MKRIFFLIASVCLLAALAIIGAWYATTRMEPQLGSYTVARGNVVASLDIPGMVSSDNSVAISFQEGGQITSVAVKEGDTVAQGEVLARLDDSSLEAGLSQANAALAEAQANQEKIIQGSTGAQVTVGQKAVDGAQVALQDAETNLVTVTSQQKTIVQNAYTALVNTSITAVPSPGNPDSIIPVVTGTYTSTTEGSYAVSVYRDTQLEFRTSGLEQVTGLASPQPAPLGKSGLSIQFPQAPSTIDTWTITIPNTAVAAYVTNENSYQAALSNQSAQISTAQSQVNAAQAALAQAQANLGQTVSHATSAETDAAKAAVAQAQAGVQNAKILLDHATIVAPFSGVVRDVEAKSGMVVASGAPMLSIINSGGMKFDAYASETDVPKIQTGAMAAIALDAYGNGTAFPARVAAVDTAETIINGSPAYHVTLYFTQPDARINAGMTGNVRIVTAQQAGVVEIPSRLILDASGSPVVLTQRNGKYATQPVAAGLVGDDGMTEITSGLDAGDRISDF